VGSAPNHHKRGYSKVKDTMNGAMKVRAKTAESGSTPGAAVGTKYCHRKEKRNNK